MAKEFATRRKILQLTASATAVGIAGCSSNAPSGSNQDDGSGTATTDSPGNDGHGDQGHSEESKIGTAVQQATVKLVSEDSGSHFEPHVIHLKKGGIVTWNNESGSHSATAYHPDNDKPLRIPEDATAWDSGVLSESGATFEHTFKVAGVYDYFCTPHETTGMLGSIIVGDPETAKQPGLKSPQDDLPSKAQTKIKDLNKKVKSGLE